MQPASVKFVDALAGHDRMDGNDSLTDRRRKI
jgi:hypothetical protein